MKGKFWLTSQFARLALQRCLGCDLALPKTSLVSSSSCSSDVWLCPSCLGDLPWLGSVCLFCSMPLPENAVVQTCGQCQQKAAQQGPAKGFMVAPFAYQAPIDQWIHAFKFSRLFGYDEFLADLMASYIADFYSAQGLPLPQCLIPVPLHRRRFWARGYNPAGLLAQCLAHRLGLAFDAHALRRHRHTHVQRELKRKQRLANVRDAFTASESLAYRHIALIDDVHTSGATAEACQAALLRAGVEQVDIWVLAKNLGD